MGSLALPKRIRYEMLISFRIIKINENDMGGHITHVGETRNACKIFVAKPERVKPTVEIGLYRTRVLVL